MFNIMILLPSFFNLKEEEKRKKMSGRSGKNDSIMCGRFHCVVDNFADSPKLLPNGLIGLWRTNLVADFNY